MKKAQEYLKKTKLYIYKVAKINIMFRYMTKSQEYYYVQNH